MTPETALQELNQTLIQCRRCERLTTWRESIAQTRKRAYQNETYWGKPVPGFGDSHAEVMIVGLAPGAHGSNRTGRMFTGDSSGHFLYAALYRAGFASQPHSLSITDGLSLRSVYITAICRCAPPNNKPTPQEIQNCRPYLEQEIELFPHLKGFVALGNYAFQWLVQWYRQHGENGTREWVFAHNALYPSQNGLPWLLASYHPSRQNTQTGRLTQQMFDAIWQRVNALLGG